MTHPDPPSTEIRRRPAGRGRAWLGRRPPSGRRRGALARVLRGTLLVKAVLLLVVALGLGALHWRLGSGPMHLDGLSERVTAALSERLGARWRVTLAESALTLVGGFPALKVSGLDIRNPDGILVARAPEAIVAIDAWSALTGNPTPRSIEFRDVHLRARIGRDGSLSIVPPQEVEAPRPPPPAPPAETGLLDAPPAPPALGQAVKGLFDLVVDRAGVIGTLDRASAVNTRLTLVDEAGRERVAFDRLDATFDGGGEVRRFDLALGGPGGEWRMTGEVRVTPEGGRDGSVAVLGMPVRDLALLSGLSTLAGSEDLRLSGAAAVSFAADGAVQRFDATLRSNAGRLTIDDPDLPWIQIDHLALESAWDPARSALLVRTAEFRSGPTRIALAGEIVREAGDWRLALAGRDAVLRGATPADRPIRLDSIDLRARGGPGGVVLEQARLRGPEADVAVALSFGGAGDRGGLRIGVTAGPTDARAALRIWPDFTAVKARAFLVDNLTAGRLRGLQLTGVLTGEDFAAIAADRGLPAEAIALDVQVDDATLQIARGLPPLTRLSVGGRVTGMAASLRSTGGAVRMPDGRTLAFQDGAFTVADLWPDAAIAQLDFRLEGGADALVSLLRSPGLKEESGIDLDPATVKGLADLRIALPLRLYDPPRMADLPLSATGRLTDLTLDKAFGRDRLEGGQIAIAYERGALSARGEARLGGSPATLELRQPKGGAGEVQVALTLDEAARARRGLAFGGGLAGPLPLKLAVPLGRGRGGVKVEADLTRLAIDNLVPGWEKAAGRPGRLAFTLHEEGAGEIRDLVLEAGPVQMRGGAVLSTEGGIERADLPTFRLSPGDDMRLQIERAGGTYRAVIRGNMADARPFLKAARAPAAPPGRPAPRDRDGRDLDLDLAVNILNGHNDETLTKAAVRATIRDRDLKDIQLSGRFPGAPVSAQIARSERGTPVLIVQAADAGALLRFTDVYRRMVGGEFQLQMVMGEARQQGNIQVRNFVLRDEPALRRIANQGSAPAAGEGRGAAPPINVGEVSFNRLRGDFVRTATRLDFEDAVISGTQVGFTLSGWIDYARDRADIAGTFVPAYGLNNAIAQVPLFGPLLSGGQNEGLFAVNFRISGAASAPTLTVNPLSALAPGIFRKLFGARAADPGGVPPPRAPER